jgi:fumarylacetoacetate (FAA) hydrolase family protein
MGSLPKDSCAALLPDDLAEATLVGRLRLEAGPTPVVIRGGAVEEVSAAASTVADLLDRSDPAGMAGRRLFGVEDLDLSALLSPLDLQVVKAAGVTFAISAIERVIEERARGDSTAAAAIRDRLEARIGGAIRQVVPGTPEAAALKSALIEDGLWSQYLEVAIGPDAEIFT